MFSLNRNGIAFTLNILNMDYKFDIVNDRIFKTYGILTLFVFMAIDEQFSRVMSSDDDKRLRSNM